MKAENLLIPGLLVGGVALYAFNEKKKKDLEAEKRAEEATKEPTPGKKAKVKPAPKANAQEKAFIDAVRSLQTELGVSPTTGFVGDKTKTALASYKLTTNVTAANVKDLIAQVKSAKAKKTAPPVQNLAQQAVELWKKYPNSKLVLLNDIKIRPKVYNILRKIWIDDPNSWETTWYKGKTISHKDGSIQNSTTSNKILLVMGGKNYLLPAESVLIQS